MNPFLLQLSHAIHEERLREAANRRRFYATTQPGTAKPVLSWFRETLVSLVRKVNVLFHSDPATFNSQP